MHLSIVVYPLVMEKASGGATGHMCHIEDTYFNMISKIYYILYTIYKYSCLSVCIFVCLYVYIYVCLSIYLSICLYTCLSIYKRPPVRIQYGLKCVVIVIASL